jgi:hypothetical protein
MHGTRRWKLALILVCMCSFLLFVSHQLGSAFANTKLFSIKGEGFGNNGLSFKSFVDCGSSQRYRYYDGGSYTNFTYDSSNTSKNQNGMGKWMIRYESGGLSGSNIRLMGGFLTNGKLIGNNYSLAGIETLDSVCGIAPSPILLSGECGENKAVNYQFSNGEKTGSTAPPDGREVFYLFGSDVRCSVNNFSP